jgi:PAS domain S-box-containing protein
MPPAPLSYRTGFANGDTGIALLKRNGFSNPTARHSAIRAAVDGERVRRAIETGRIYPVFQPIIRLQSGSISSFEVLARWYDDEFGPIPPTQFIPVAESAGLMSDLTSSLIRTACAAAGVWNGKFRLAFNISALQFQGAMLPSQIEAAARGTGFPLSRFQLEITESAVIDDLESARVSIDRLKMLGVQILLDDFGTGFSSLTRLQALPFDKIKIEASFVQSMASSRDSRKIVSAVIGLGQSLGLPVIAEGVETPAQLRMLMQLGCDYGQGYLFSRPTSAESIPTLIGLRGEQADDPPPLNLSSNLKLAQLKAIYAGAPFALYFVDLERRYVSANKRFAEMVGVNLERLIGRRVEEIYPDGLPYVVADLEAVVTGRRLASRECLMPNGRMVMSTAAAARDEDDEVVGMIDITKYKRPPAPELERAKSPVNGDKPFLDGKERQNADALGGRRS